MRPISKALLLGATAALFASAAIAGDNLAGYQTRDDTMKQIGRNFYIGIGRVVQGRNPYGPETVTAAETVTKLLAGLPNLFPPGSDVTQSKMNPAILTAADRDTLIANVQQAAAGLVPAVKDGATNKEAMASAYKAVNDACNACHKKYRNE
jgi:cytochrome c556